jgi:hypothetical protein
MTSGAEADWVGFSPDTDAIEPLTTEAFVQRLTRLSILALRLRQLRRAMNEQHPEYAARLPEIPADPF